MTDLENLLRFRILDRRNCDDESIAELMTVAADRIAELERENERHETALQRIKQWADAYPLDVFPEPDFKKVNEVLKAAGLSLDQVSASNMRHVVKGVGDIASQSLMESVTK